MSTASKLTTNQVARGFGVTPMTLWLWRQGKMAKTPLPHDVEMRGKAPRVSFRLAQMKAWSKKNGVPFDPEAALGGAAAAKSGPAPKAAPGRERGLH